MSIVGVFARADHPHGWGYAGPPHDPHRGRAHGYVVLFVRCTDLDELASVTWQLGHKDFTGALGATQYSRGFLGEWFGGRFDHIATVPDVDIMAYGPFQCRGDNRMVAIFEAADVLEKSDA